jgi:hypothetical protein
VRDELNLKVSKLFTLGREAAPMVRLSVYADARNVLNRRIVRWCGSPVDG